MNFGLFSGSSELPRLLRRHGGTSRTKPSSSSDFDVESAQLEDETFHPLLSLVHLQSQLNQLTLDNYTRLENKGHSLDFLTLNRFNALEKTPFDALQDIGSGSTFSVKSFAPVWKHSPLDSNLNGAVVAKRIRPSSDAEILRSRLESVKLEILALRDPILGIHENIVDFLGLWWENNPYGGCPLPVLILEQANYGTLIDLQRRPLTLRYTVKRRLCLDIALGLEALHEASIVHGDLKSENVLVFKQSERGYIAKLSDFGSTIAGGHHASILGKKNVVYTREDAGKRYRVSVISFPWNAPEYEYHMEGFQLRLLDAYSFGLLVWRTMMDGRDPFETVNSLNGSEDKFTEIEMLKRKEDFAGIIRESFETTRVLGELAQDVDIESVSSVVKDTVQVDPDERNLRAAIVHLGGKPSSLNMMRHKNEVIDMDDFGGSDTGVRPRLKRLEVLTDSNLSIPIGLDIAVSNWVSVITKECAIRDITSSCAQMYLPGELSGTVRSLERDPASLLDVLRKMALHYEHLDENDSRQTQLDDTIMDIARMDVVQMAGALDCPLDMDIVVEEIIQTAAGRGSGPALDILSREGPATSYNNALQNWRNRNGGYLFEMKADEIWDLSQPEELKKTLTRLMYGAKCISKHISRAVYEGLSGNRQEDSIDVNKIWVSTDFKSNLLHHAVKCGALSVVEMLLSDFPFDINCRNWLQETPLLVAMRSGHSPVANFLIDKGADCSKRDLFQENALHWICRIDSQDIPDLIRRLSNAGCDMNAVSCKDIANVTDDDESDTWDLEILDSDSESGGSDSSNSDDINEFAMYQYEQLIRTFTAPGTPLHRAVVENKCEAVISLCQSGCDTTVKCSITNIPMSPFEVAICRHQIEIAAAIIPFYPRTESQDWLQALMLVISPFWTSARIALHGKHYNSARQRALEFSLSRLQPADIRASLSLGILVSVADSTVLQAFLGNIYTSLEEPMEILDLQLRPLAIALCDGKLDSLVVLLEAGAECNFYTSDIVGSTNCLHRLSHLGIDDVRFGEVLLKYCDQSFLLPMSGGIMTGGTTPFVFAVTQGCFEMAKLFLTYGADIDALAVTQISEIFFTGMTALGRLAMSACDTSVPQLKFLLDSDRLQRSSFVVAPATGFTVLHAAVLCPKGRQSNPDTIVNLTYLLSVFHRQDELDQIDRFGCTALHLAVICGNYEAVATLLDAGASHDSKLYKCLEIRPVDVARARVGYLTEWILEEDANNEECAATAAMHNSMAIVDQLNRACTNSVAEASSSEPDLDHPVDPLIENAYSMAREYSLLIQQYRHMWAGTQSSETEWLERVIKIIKDSLNVSGLERVHEMLSSEHSGKGKSRVEEVDECAFKLPFWWMIMGWPSTEQQTQLARYLRQRYPRWTRLRSDGVLKIIIDIKQDETGHDILYLHGSIKSPSPDEPSVIETRCLALLKVYSQAAAAIEKEPISDSESETDPGPMLSPELLRELEGDPNVIFISDPGDSSDDDDNDNRIGFATRGYSTPRQAWHSVLKNNRRTQRQLDKVLGPARRDSLD
ncbi:Protein kinase-like (PK-like) [Glarea lozoyensis ATCC 20868]|uniref:Protein kinase-like (PK-like) n=1 Tax=Glarea lozoyensis (strain ATCC 20868 / MF5171) TaxID=1116229 RepID=S3D7N2_GLAL2|nr:Protein kinase-like (PK-like) [Glarea lozoyensis ATCC 20868]EPE28021.1 Protein kinase-like (PK-like) [Glarea lozoyensis ATCC 20868]